MASFGDDHRDSATRSMMSTPTVDEPNPHDVKFVDESLINMDSPVLPTSKPHFSQYDRKAHRDLALFLENAKTTGKLGDTKELADRDFTPIKRFRTTIPWIMLIIQLVWSVVVTAIAYVVVRDRGGNTLTSSFWNSLWLLTPTVVSGVGWALFVLLGFFIREAANRYREALLRWGTISALLKQVIRQLVQAYPEGTWHPGDHDRMVAHLIAYPIALKMTLREERDGKQLMKVLNTRDVDDIIEAESMHLHCSQVVRAYFCAGEDDADAGFKPAAEKTPAGWGPRYFVIDLVDAIDAQAAGAERIKNFHPAVGYSSHLRNFLYIWLLLLPMSIIQTSGWFTPLWSVIITYGIGMLFTIAMNLNEPYGFDLEDIKLNSLCAESALGALDTYALGQVKLEEIIKEEAAPLPWISSESAQEDEYYLTTKKKRIPIIGWLFRFLKTMTFRPQVAIPMACFVLWMVFVVFLTWGLGVHVFELDLDLPNENTDDSIFCPNARWWCMYIPLSSSTTAYIGLGIFLLLGFWINDAYGRYKTGISLWQVNMRRSLEHVAMIFCTEFRNESWHPGDRERLLSYIVALPYAAKLALRDSRDAEELSKILSKQDYLALTKAKDFPEYCLSVIHGYLNSADCEHETFKVKNPMTATRWTVEYVLWDFELALEECEEIHKFPIPHAFTFHLRVFSTVWLAALPLAFVNFYGFVSFLFLLPVGYSIINLLVMGTELADPFGTDEHDIPLDVFCDQMKISIYKMYRETIDGPKSYMMESSYDRADFEPSFWNSDPSILETDNELSLKRSVKAILDAFPSVNIWVFLTFFVWCCAAVGISYAFQFTWSEGKREDCPAWCSPIDVDGNVLLEIGFALFLILSFRASDALERYAEGSSLLSKVGQLTRNFAMEIIQTADDGTWHKGDKERLVAHIVQLPLAIRDRMLGIKRLDPQEKEGVLSDEDRLAMETSGDAVRHCLQLLHTYINMLDCTDVEHRGMCATTLLQAFKAYAFNKRIYHLRMTVAKALVMKSFPVVRSYTRHQRVFTAIWLVLLPLALTPQMGFWTILWVPLISYGVLALETIATELMDPFGTDSTDISLDKVCKGISEDILEGVLSVKWDCDYHVLKSVADSKPSFDVVLQGRVVLDKYSLPQFLTEHVDMSTFGRTLPPNYKSPQLKMTKPTLYAHFLRSVPWWLLLGAALWTALAVIVSYLARGGEPAERWWNSQLHIDPLVGSYVSFAAFMLLGFYVNAAFGRYSMAGNVWGDDLRAACHSFATQLITLAPPGTWHEGDHERILAHVASLPIALKKDLRGDRDLLELKGLLSEKDIGRMHCAKSMSKHCLDVLRSYFLMGTHRLDRLAIKRVNGSRDGFLFRELGNMGEAVRCCLFLKTSQIAPGFMVLLRTLLGIWFVLLPFVLAESDGWFAILWVTVIAYGVIGVYAVAQELQHPFGTDLNDLDLDRMSSEIMEDILSVQKNYRHGVDTFVLDIQDSGDIWREDTDKSLLDEKLNLVSKDVKKEVKSGIIRNLSLAIHAVSWWMLVAVVAWTLIYVGIAYAVNRKFPFLDDGKETEACDPGFCSRIAITGPVKEYIGFALFLLLGFRLYDSHWRYVTAMKTWEDGIIGITGLLANRVFESFNENTFHRGDLERMAAHLAAFSVVTAARLRRTASSADILSQFMHPDDVLRIESMKEKGDYCLDVLRGYFIKDELKAIQGIRTPVGANEAWVLMYYLETLQKNAAVCERMIRVPLPFGYVQHIRIFLVIWLLLLPLGLVETQSWYSAIWSVFIAYGLIGVERWSEELADPFGTDLSDLPLGKLRMRAVKSVKENLELFRHGTQSVIKVDREAFPSGKGET